MLFNEIQLNHSLLKQPVASNSENGKAFSECLRINCLLLGEFKIDIQFIKNCMVI